MEKLMLLPGVSKSASPPDVVFQSRRVIASARRRAAVRDVFDLLLLAAVDALFLQWPHAHIPSLDRTQTFGVLVAVNLALIAYAWSMRAVPRWRARKVASTWTAGERQRLFTPPLH